MSDGSVLFERVREHWENIARDEARAHAIYARPTAGTRAPRPRAYVTEAWEAPEWRAPWRSEAPADPPA